MAFLDALLKRLTKPLDYFNPSSNRGENFWSTQTAQTLADIQQAPATRFVAGALDSLYHRVVKPYGALLGEAAYQGGRYLFDPTFRKAVQGKPLTGEEAEKLNKRPDTLFLKPEQVENRKQIAKTGTAATSKAVLATLGLSNPASALTSAAIAGGLGYGAAKLGGAKDPFYEAGKAAGYSPVYAGINRLTGGPQDILASSLLGKGAGFLQRGLVKGGIYGTGNVLEELIFTPLTEQRSPTGSELAIAGGTGLLSGVGGEALGALKETVKAKIKRLKPDLSDQEAAKQAERYLRLEAGRVVGRQPKLDRKEVKFIGDLREELGLSRYGDEIPQVGLGVRPRSEAEHLDSLKRGAKSALDQELTGMGYSPEQIARLSAKEKRRILKENIPPFAHESFQGGEQASAKATPGQDAALGQIAEAESPQGLKRLFNRLFNPLKNAPASAQEAATAWRKETLTARAEANALAQKFAHIPAEDGWKMARYIQNPTKETAQRLGFDPSRYQTELKELRNVYNQMRREGIKRGLDIGYLENYLNQVWEESWDEIDRRLRSASGKPYFTKERVIPSYEEGIKLGLTPRFTHPAQLVAHYREALGKALANKKLVEELVKSGYLVPAQDAPLDWQRIEAPLFPKVTKIVGKQKRIISDYKAPPSIAEAINNIFQPGGGGGSGLEELAALGAKVSKAMQEITLSGGYGPANAFTYGQMIKEVTAGRVRSPLSSFFRSFSEKASNRFFAEHQETIKRMAQEGIPLHHAADYAEMFDNLAKNKTLKDKLGDLWNQVVNEPTFKRFLPMLQVNFFDDAYRQALKEGFSPQEAQRIAGEATKNFYGIVDNFSRSQFVEDAVTSAFFAPKFRESMVNFWVNNLKALAPKHWKDPAFKANRKFLVGTVLTYLLYNALNKALTGHAMSENKGGKELSLEIPVGEGRSIFIPLLPSVGTLPRRLGEMAGALKEGDIATATQKAGSFLSQPVSLGSQLLSNRTFYGGPIYQKDDTALEKAGKLAGYALEQSAHPLVGEPMAVLQGRKTPFEALLGMAEVPAYPSASTPEKRLPLARVETKAKEKPSFLKGIFSLRQKEEPLRPLPDETKALAVIYNEARKVLEDYEERRAKIEYGRYDSESKRQKDLQALEENRAYAQAILERLQREKPDKLFEIGLEVYASTGSATVEERAKWAAEQLKQSAEDKEAFQKKLKKMLEAGVITKGVAELLREEYDLPIYQYKSGGKIVSMGDKSLQEIFKALRQDAEARRKLFEETGGGKKASRSTALEAVLRLYGQRAASAPISSSLEAVLSRRRRLEPIAKPDKAYVKIAQ